MAARTGGRGLAWLAGLAVLLGLVMVWPYLVDGFRFGVGPDVPVYLWWTRVGASEGLSLLGSRPGAPALAAALGGTLWLDAAAVTAALPGALGVAAGAAAAGLARAAGHRGPVAWLAGLLTGVFSVHLVAGYLANLVFAVTFLAAAACLAGSRRSWPAAALLLAGGGLAHPPFLVHGIVVLAGAAALAWRGGGGGGGGRDEARDVARAAGLGGLVAAAGVLVTLAGPGPLDVETSKDAYLRRAGLGDALVDAYRERFRLRAARYVQWVAVPLAIAGTVRNGGFLRRLLASWLVVIAIGIPLGWVTGWFPPDRLVTFGFAVPVAAALGLPWVTDRMRGRAWLAAAAALVLAGWMVAGALLAWGRQAPFVQPREAELAWTGMLRAQAFGVTEQRPVVVVVDDADTTATFLGARAANVLRAAAPPDLVDDLHLFVGTVDDLLAGRPTVRGDPEYDALSRVTFASIPRTPEPIVLVVAPFYRGLAPGPPLSEQEPGIWSSEGLPEFSVAAGGPLSFGASSGIAITLATVGVFAALTLLGWSYAAWAFRDRLVVAATAPAFGAAAVSLAAVALDALGLRLGDVWVAPLASLLAGIGGVAVYLVQRGRRPQPAA